LLCNNFLSRSIVVNGFESGTGALKMKFKKLARSHALWSGSTVFTVNIEFFANAAIFLD